MAEWVESGACELCGSSSAKALYSDGSTFCFKPECGTYGPPDGGKSSAVSARKDLLIVEPLSLEKRRISIETCRLWGYGISEYHGETVQVAQFRSKRGQIEAQKIRTANKDFFWLGNRSAILPLFGQHLWTPHSKKKIIITEGELDALSVSQSQGNQWPVVSLPDGAGSALKVLPKAIDYLNGFKEIILMFDQDEPGQTAAYAAASLLPPGKVKIATLALKDPSELLQEDRGAEIIKAIFEAVSYRPDSILAGEELIEHLFRPAPLSVPYFMTSLSLKLKGLRKKEITMVVAGSGIGKTTFCQEQTYYLLQKGYKVGLVYLEQSIQITLLNILSIPLNKRLKLIEETPKAELIKEFKKIQNRLCVYNHFGSKDPTRLMQELRYMIQAEECDFIVFDHISIVISGNAVENERQSIDFMMTGLRQLVEETGAGIILVSHLKRVQGTGFDEGRMPTMSDCRGSASLEQLSDVMIGLGRNLAANSDVMEVAVLKDRWIGDTGLVGTIQFNKTTGRLFNPVELFDDTTQYD
jgi:twinkle protein